MFLIEALWGLFAGVVASQLAGTTGRRALAGGLVTGLAGALAGPWVYAFVSLADRVDVEVDFGLLAASVLGSVVFLIGFHFERLVG
jgi:uncharacterized membrane protein YeaQ/YmgE (transglycosylase-associated protein family)